MLSIVGEQESGHAKLEARMVWTVWDIYIYIYRYRCIENRLFTSLESSPITTGVWESVKSYCDTCM